MSDYEKAVREVAPKNKTEIVTTHKGKPSVDTPAQLRAEALYIDTPTVAERFLTPHYNVMRDVATLVKNGVFEHIKKSTYVDSRGRTQACYHLTLEQFGLLNDKKVGIMRVPNFIVENAALAAVEVLIGRALCREFNVAGYRVDGYDPVANVAYEVDGAYHHNAPQQQRDSEREARIVTELGCTFVRIPIRYERAQKTPLTGRELMAAGMCPCCEAQPLKHGPWTAEQIAAVCEEAGYEVDEFEDWCNTCMLEHVFHGDREFAAKHGCVVAEVAA